MNSNTLMEALGCSQAAADLYAPILTKYFAQYGIDSVQDQADFLGQIAVETGDLRSISENPMYSEARLASVFKSEFRERSPAEAGMSQFADGKRGRTTISR